MSETSPITKLHKWFAGEDKILQWIVLESDEDDVQDITGWTLEFRMALSEGGTSVLTLDATVVNATAGLCRVQVPASDTSALAPKQYFYQLWRTNSGANAVVADGPAFLRARVAA